MSILYYVCASAVSGREACGFRTGSGQGEYGRGEEGGECKDGRAEWKGSRREAGAGCQDQGVR